MRRGVRSIKYQILHNEMGVEVLNSNTVFNINEMLME